MGISLPNREYNSTASYFYATKNAARFGGGVETVNKTRSMVPSESESPLLSIPQPHFSTPRHALLVQLPLFSCPCFTISTTSFPYIQETRPCIHTSPDSFTLIRSSPGALILHDASWRYRQHTTTDFQLSPSSTQPKQGVLFLAPT